MLLRNLNRDGQDITFAGYPATEYISVHPVGWFLYPIGCPDIRNVCIFGPFLNSVDSRAPWPTLDLVITKISKNSQY